MYLGEEGEAGERVGELRRRGRREDNLLERREGAVEEQALALLVSYQIHTSLEDCQAPRLQLLLPPPRKLLHTLHPLRPQEKAHEISS